MVPLLRHGYFKESGKYFQVLKYVDFGFYEVCQKGKLTDQQFAYLVVNMLNTVYESHNNGIAYRDYKPDNFRINDKGQLVLVDSGGFTQRSDDRLFSIDSVVVETPEVKTTGFVPEIDTYDPYFHDRHAIAKVLLEVRTGYDMTGLAGLYVECDESKSTCLTRIADGDCLTDKDEYISLLRNSLKITS